MTLASAVDGVLARDACSGCGLCARLDSGIEMQLDHRGYLRPRLVGVSAPVAQAEGIFSRSCPGVVVAAPSPPPEGAERHPELGTYLAAWRAWAADPEVRRAGSSGGVLTALHTWLLATGRAARVTGAAAKADDARRTIPVTITTRDAALASAGSRYAPVATLANSQTTAEGSAVTGKPCEISALRRAASDLVDGDHPLMLSFFCAGTPSQGATDTLLHDLGVAPEAEVRSLRYRGDGWPGRFRAQTRDLDVSADYDDSWGRVLGPTTQWRCKVCVDGVGESADIVCADSWATDKRGYPVFVEGDGVSALIARTPRGLEAIEAAVAAGIIAVEPLEMSQLAAAQPLQVARRRFLFARMLGSRLAGRRPPRYRGFGLLRLSLARPREALRTLRGTYRRVRAQRSF